MNINLNPGGIVGAVIGIGGVISATILQSADAPPKAMLVAGFAGGAAGNALWSFFFPATQAAPDKSIEPPPSQNA